MKNILTIIGLLLTTVIYGQTAYLSTGLSVTNSDNFKDSSYLSVEGGISKNNFSYGLVLGSNDLNFKEFWYEGKVSYTVKNDYVDPYVLLGVGSYFNKYQLFIEYGAGLTKSFGNVSPYVQYSKWNGGNYITTGLTFNL